MNVVTPCSSCSGRFRASFQNRMRHPSIACGTAIAFGGSSHPVRKGGAARPAWGWAERLD